MVAGDIIKEFDMQVVVLTLKTTTGCAKGDVLAWDTDGYNLADSDAVAANKGPFYVALETVAAPGSGQSTVRALSRGAVAVNKVTGAINQGQYVAQSTTAGKVTAYTAPDAPATYAEAAMQSELDKLEQIVGRALTAAASGDSTVDVLLSGR